MSTITINVPVQIEEQAVRDLLGNAIEGGSTYWCDSIDRHGVTQKQAPYRQDVPFVEGGKLEVRGAEEPDKPIFLTRETLVGGLILMALKYPRHWQDFMNDNADATTGDVFLQLCCFGDVIYG